MKSIEECLVVVKKLVSEQLEEPVSDTESLVASGRLTSLMIVEVILSIEDNLGIQLNPQDITAEQFDTVELMAKTVSSLSA